MLNSFAANKRQAIMALLRLQSMGINEDQILNMAQQTTNSDQKVTIGFHQSWWSLGRDL
jgi:hypothetical protein